MGEWRPIVQSRSNSVTSPCQCGCTLTDHVGHIIAAGGHLCETSVRRWSIRVEAGFNIKLSIDYFTLGRLSSLRVYDTAAGAHMALLLKLPDDKRDEDAGGGIRTVVTSGNSMVVEYTNVGIDVGLVRNSDGFIASYVATGQFTGITSLQLGSGCTLAHGYFWL